MATSADHVTVLLAPRINGSGNCLWAIIYRRAKVAALPLADLEDAQDKITECAMTRFGMTELGAKSLAHAAVNRYAAGVVATEEAHSLAKVLQDQLDDSRRVILALTEELEAARRP